MRRSTLAPDTKAAIIRASLEVVRIVWYKLGTGEVEDSALLELMQKLVDHGATFVRVEPAADDEDRVLDVDYENVRAVLTLAGPILDRLDQPVRCVEPGFPFATAVE